MFNSTPGLSLPPGCQQHPLSHGDRECLQTLPNVPSTAKSPPLGKRWSTDRLSIHKIILGVLSSQGCPNGSITWVSYVAQRRLHTIAPSGNPQWKKWVLGAQSNRCIHYSPSRLSLFCSTGTGPSVSCIFISFGKIISNIGSSRFGGGGGGDSVLGSIWEERNRKLLCTQNSGLSLGGAYVSKGGRPLSLSFICTHRIGLRILAVLCTHRKPWRCLAWPLSTLPRSGGWAVFSLMMALLSEWWKVPCCTKIYVILPENMLSKLRKEFFLLSSNLIRLGESKTE